MDVKIEKKTTVGIIVTAIVIDSIQALLTPLWIGLLINPVISVGAAYIFNRWFKIYGINMFSKDNMGIFYGTIAAELIPFFDALPVWTTGVIVTLVRNRTKNLPSKK